MANLGDKLRELRQRKKLSMRELGEALGVSHAHISKIESGNHKASLGFIEKLAEYFDVDDSFFFVDEEQMNEYTETEKEVFFNRKLTPKELKAKYTFIVDEDDEENPATDEEIAKMVEYIKVLRALKSNK